MCKYTTGSIKNRVRMYMYDGLNHKVAKVIIRQIMYKVTCTDGLMALREKRKEMLQSCAVGMIGKITQKNMNAK